MTEGTIDLALMTYDSEDEPEAQLSGSGPCIHHFGVEVEDREATMKTIMENGGERFSDPEEGALKYRGPDGVMQEIVNVGRYKLRERSPKARIVHLALKVDDLDKATNFYKTVFGFKQLNDTRHGHHTSRHMTDGNLDIALMKWDQEDEIAKLAGPGPRVHHWGLEVADREAFAEIIKKHGGEILSKPEAPTLRFRAPDRTLTVEEASAARDAAVAAAAEGAAADVVAAAEAAAAIAADVAAADVTGADATAIAAAGVPAAATVAIVATVATVAATVLVHRTPATTASPCKPSSGHVLGSRHTAYGIDPVGGLRPLGRPFGPGLPRPDSVFGARS
jgi:lactoylglutathione lyase